MARRLEHWTHWFGGREEYILKVCAADGGVVLRGCPDARVVTVFEVLRDEAANGGGPVASHLMVDEVVPGDG